MERQILGRSYRVCGLSPPEVWLTVLWSGEEPGARTLILPNEELVAVNPRIYFKTSSEAFCNFTGLEYSPGNLHVIILELNITVSLEFTHENESVVYNVYTYESVDDYEPKEIVLSLEEHLEFVTEVSAWCLLFGAVAAYTAIKVRSAT